MVSHTDTHTSASTILFLPACTDPRCRCQKCVDQRVETYRRMVALLAELQAAADADEPERNQEARRK